MSYSRDRFDLRDHVRHFERNYRRCECGGWRTRAAVRCRKCWDARPACKRGHQDWYVRPNGRRMCRRCRVLDARRCRFLRRARAAMGSGVSDPLPLVDATRSARRMAPPARVIRWESQCCRKCPAPVAFCLRLGFCSRAARAERLLERRGLR